MIIKVGEFLFYDRPSSKARLVHLPNGTCPPEMTGDEVGANWSGERVELLEIRESVQPDGHIMRRFVARTDSGAVFLDETKAFA